MSHMIIWNLKDGYENLIKRKRPAKLKHVAWYITWWNQMETWEISYELKSDIVIWSLSLKFKSELKSGTRIAVWKLD